MWALLTRVQATPTSVADSSGLVTEALYSLHRAARSDLTVGQALAELRRK